MAEHWHESCVGCVGYLAPQDGGRPAGGSHVASSRDYRLQSCPLFQLVI